MNEHKEKKAISPFTRAIALLLVISLLASTVLYQRAGIYVDGSDSEDRSVRIAAEQLMSQNEYFSASRLERMAYLLGEMLGIEGSDLSAQIAIAQGNYEKAAEETLKALPEAKGEEITELTFRLGYLYTILGRYTQALEWLDKGIEIHSGPGARLVRAQVKLNLGDVDGALADLEAVFTVATVSEELLPYVVNVYEAAEQYDQAVECYDRMIAKEDRAEERLNRAYCYTKLGRMQEAAADVKAYAELGGTENAQAAAMLGLGWMKAGDLGKAKDCFLQAAKQGYPDGDSLSWYLVSCAYAQADYAVAAEYGDPLVDRLGKGERLQAGEFAVDSKTGRLRVKLTGMDEQGLCLRTGAAHFYQGAYGKAESCLTVYLNLGGNDGTGYYLRGVARMVQGRYSEAEEDLGKAIDRGAYTDRCLYDRAVCRFQLGRLQDALSDLESASQATQDGALVQDIEALRQEIQGTSE